MNISVIIPSLNPDDKLLLVVEGMIAAGFEDIIVVDDGSDEAHKAPFEKIKGMPGCTVLAHEINRGKGRALKTAFDYYEKNRKNYVGAVTVDGDNQHRPQDVMACAEEMMQYPDNLILGVRDFDSSGVPFKSRIGNKITSFVFKFVCGLDISDTQTGLRAIPSAYISEMSDIEGERFEYETNMLLALKKNRIPFRQVPISTVYINENETSHFHPLRDSIKIYGIIMKYLLGSFASSLVDLGAFAIINFLLSPVTAGRRVFLATIFARGISSLFNYTYNRKAVFGASGSIRKTVLKYYTLCVCQMLVSYGMVYAVTSLLTAGNVMIVIIKAVIDTLLFIISFQIQRLWVFSDR